MNEDINTAYPTFGALARSAMVLGIPLPALAVCGFIGLMATLMAMPFLSGKALLFLLLPVPVLLFLRTICANDTQALTIIMTETRWFLSRRNIKLFNGTTTILSTKYGRTPSDYQRFFEQNTQAAACAARLSAQSLPTRR